MTRLPPRWMGEIHYHCRVMQTRRKLTRHNRLGNKPEALITDDNASLLSAMSAKVS
jgi:hypothetical protein